MDYLCLFFFEFKNFGSGFYDFNIAYYDEEMGKVDDGQYFAIPIIKKPRIKGSNADELHAAADLWLELFKRDIISFIENHSAHKTILDSDKFYYASNNEHVCKELMRRKSNM